MILQAFYLGFCSVVGVALGFCLVALVHLLSERGH